MPQVSQPFASEGVQVTEAPKVSIETAVRLALAIYLGEQCKYCGKVYKTLDDVKDIVYAGYHERGRLACQKCWNENNKAN